MTAVRTLILQPNRLDTTLNVLLAIYVFIYVFSVPMLMLDLVPAWGQGMGGLLLVLQGTLTGLWLAGEAGGRGAAAAVLIAVLAFLVEYTGVTTGIPFGAYIYTPTLGLHLGAVPLAIPFAWMMVVPGALMLAAPAGAPTRVLPLAATFALLLDMVLEPVVTHVLGYWHWQVPGAYYGVPASNFIAWGGTALVLLLVLHLLVPHLPHTVRRPGLPNVIFLLTLLQFILVNAAYSFWWAVVVGIGLLLGIWLLWGRPRLSATHWRRLWIST